MIPALLTAIVILIALACFLLLRGARLNAELLATQADAERLDKSVRHNLRAIRARVGHFSPEAIKLCDALESPLQARCRVDLDLLERVLMALRRAHNATLLDAAKTGEPYRGALRDLLVLIRSEEFGGQWERLEPFDDILALPRGDAIESKLAAVKGGAK